MGRLNGKVALITGAARGIGAAECAVFAREGAAVVLADIRDELTTVAANSIVQAGGRALQVHLDVTDETDWGRAVAAAEREFGRLNVLVNNAGTPQHPSPADELARDEWERVIGINLTGQFLGAKSVIPAMKRAGGGSIVNTSSVAGLVASRAASYGASKGGVRLLSKSIALQYAEFGIRCNSVHPGPVDTDFDGPYRNDQTLPRTLARIPLRRMATPDEIAYGALYLASDESSFVTGSELVIDGGTTAV